LPWRKLSKNHWQIETSAASGVSTITVCYRVFAHELSVRTNHLDATHAISTARLCFRIPGIAQPIRVTIVPPRVARHSPYQRFQGAQHFQALDFDTLVDSPFEMVATSCITLR